MSPKAQEALLVVIGGLLLLGLAAIIWFGAFGMDCALEGDATIYYGQEPIEHCSLPQ